MCSTVGRRATTGCVMIAVRHADPLSRRWSAAIAGELRLSVARPRDPDNTCVSSRTTTAERPRHDPPRSCDGVVRRGGRWPADDGAPSTVAAQQPALAVPRTRRSAARKEPTCWWPALVRRSRLARDRCANAPTTRLHPGDASPRELPGRATALSSRTPAAAGAIRPIPLGTCACPRLGGVRPAAEPRPPEVGGDRTRPGGPVRSATRRSAGVLHGNPGGGKCHDAASSRGALRHAAAKSCIGRSSTSLKQAIVPNAGVGSRPVSILRNVSGDMPAACATSPRSRSARASRSSAPRRLPASICSDVSGLRTTPPRVRLVF
jgi:hypothetical protein